MNERDTLPLTDDTYGVPGGPCPACGAALMLVLDEVEDPIAVAHPLPWCALYENDPDALVASLAMGPVAGGDA